jgi:phage terminase large subunit
MAPKKNFKKGAGAAPQKKLQTMNITLSHKQGLFIYDKKVQECDFVLYGGSAGGGKAVSVDSLVATPFGFKLNGDLKKGDLVINPRTGGACTVVQAHDPIMCDVWKITFDDGTSMECNKDHLWAYRCSGNRNKRYEKERSLGEIDPWLGGYKVGDTLELKKCVDRAKDQQNRGTRANWVNIPVARATEFTVICKNPDARWLVDPYLLGLLIGDGCITTGFSVSSMDEEILKYVEDIVPERYSGRTTPIDRGINIICPELRENLKQLGISNHYSYEKFIPEAYKVAPLSIRIPLMQGLMDTDGYVDDRGHMSYCTTSKQLADDVAWLARSLGAYAKITEKQPTYTHKCEKKEGRLAYNVWIKPHDPKMFVRLTRKLDRAIDSQTQPLRQVVLVEKMPYQKEMRCITLDTIDGLYIVGEDFTVTHNSYAILVDALYYANEYKGSKQLILRETFPELERSLIMVSQQLYPTDAAQYDASNHKWYFYNGSIIEFGFLESDNDVQKYQSAEYDRIFFDEGSHFSEYRITYMHSRVRGVNDYPKQTKICTNPGGLGHRYLKKTFEIGTKEPYKVRKYFLGTDKNGNDLYETRVFIPATVYDNTALMKKDPGYIKNLMQLPLKEREQLLNGNWEIDEEAAFPEFDREIHVINMTKTFPTGIPNHWRRWISVDNGYADPYAWYWYAVDEQGTVYVYRGFTRKRDDKKTQFVYTEQARRVVEKCSYSEIVNGQIVEKQEKYDYIVAGHDAWFSNVRDTQGKTLIDYYQEGGLHGFIKAITDRKLRKAVIHEYLAPKKDENIGKMVAKVYIADNCPELIEALAEIARDPDDYEKYAEDSELDHYVDSFGYGLISWHSQKSKRFQAERTEIQKHKAKLSKHLKRRGFKAG